MSSTTPAQWCQGTYLALAATILALQVSPEDIRRAVMDYGARKKGNGADSEGKAPAPKPVKSSGAIGDTFTSLAKRGLVPHSWFLHFYMVSSLSSVFWAAQFLGRGRLMEMLLKTQSARGSSTVDFERVVLAWAMMAIQGGRRLYESLYVSKPGSSPMWFLHWVLGWLFYSIMGMGVWIEGSSSILKFWSSPSWTPSKLLSPRVPLALALFALASQKQYAAHKHLASLKKYTLPTEGWFKYLVCPHYTCDVLVYTALTLIAAPQGKMVNRTVLCGAIFTLVNLGATAQRTKEWYAEKFGEDKVQGRWKMLPFIF